MRQAVVQSLRCELLLRHRLAALNREGIGAADGEMVGCILVEQRIVENDPRIRNRRLMRNKRYLAEVARTSVRIKQPLKRLCALLRRIIDDLPVLERQGEAIDQITVVVEWLRAAYRAVHAAALRRSKHFF